MADRACSWRSWWITAQSADRQGSKNRPWNREGPRRAWAFAVGLRIFRFPKTCAHPMVDGVQRTAGAW